MPMIDVYATDGTFADPGSLAQRGIDASIDFVARLATRNACGGLTKTCR